MKTKVVVNVSVNGGQSRPSNWKRIFCCLVQDTSCKDKAMTIAATLPGVENVSLEAANNLLTVIGVGIDTVELVNILRKKVGFATVVSVGPADEKKKEDKPADDEKKQPVPGVYCCNNNQVRPMVEVFEIRDPYYYNNSCYPW
ncbi:heavy metal-associated isoprenylated plant protein 41-like [Lycium barbarum]|uniref:heavy metal-associated isoprenylated plant protein 41-like n=1 Tax=Lycium barbarum TaxID=112863 RepID=UPI00293EC05A|nr:heavy metal-associated isoprenylated plant protein 41-like [Lycium barbarum]